MSAEKTCQLLLRVGFTLILLGYLLVWLPQPVAGLSFIGLEMGEWVKFLPQLRAGQIATPRELFYLPPISLGLMLVLWTAGWPNRRWQTWAMRGVAVVVALLAFPSVEAILQEDLDQWLGRLLLVLLVAVIAILMPWLERLLGATSLKVSWGAILFLAMTGLFLPTWAYLAVRPSVAQLFDHKVGIGPGVWLNAAGHLLVAVTVLFFLAMNRRWGATTPT